MDIISHGLYGGAAFGRKNKRDYIISFLFGMGPDLMSFGVYFVLAILGLQPWPGKFEPPNYPAIPEYVHKLYNASHSLVIYAIFFGIIWFLGYKSFAKLTLAWPLHILVDIPTHSTNFFPTPFLWPISNLHVNGIPWSEPAIFIPDIIVIAIIYIYWYLKNKRKLQKQ